MTARTALASDPRFLRSRTLLIDAMTALLDDNELSGLTITDVVKRAGVTRPTFYQHAADLADLTALATFTRLESAFPHPAPDAALLDDAQRSAAIRAAAFEILQHLQQHRLFYLRVLTGAGSLALFDRLIGFIQDKLFLSGMMTGEGGARSGLLPDGGLIIASGVVWMVIRWLQSDFDGDNTLDRMADRICDARMALSRAVEAPGRD